MSTVRHWNTFSPALINLVERFYASPNGIKRTNLDKSSAYSIRNEYWRFRRACFRSWDAGEDDAQLKELIENLKAMTFRLEASPLYDNLFDIAIVRSSIEVEEDKWEDI